MIIEFAGMPKSGKTTVLSIVAQYLRRNGYALEEFHGGGRYAPIGKGDLPALNLYLACEVARFLMPIGRDCRTASIHLLDRGPNDRQIFTSALASLGQVSHAHAHALGALLDECAQLTEVDACFIFTTSTSLSLERENQNSLTNLDGRVMNPILLGALRNEALAMCHGELPMRAKHLVHVDTEAMDGAPRETARMIVAEVATACASLELEVSDAE